MKVAFLFCVRRRTHIHICLVLTFITLGCVVVADAQTNRTISSTGRRLDEFNRQSEKAARDELRREMRGRKPTTAELKRASVIKEQIREDFEGLQAAYNEILTKLHAQEHLSEVYISDVTAKIAKSGNRLRHNIAFTERETTNSEVAEVSSTRGTMNDLCLLLHKFLTNPVFETGVLDIIDAGKAGDVLDKIIQTSENLHQHFGKTN